MDASTDDHDLTLATGDSDGTVLVWPVLDGWKQVLCNKALGRLDERLKKNWITSDLPFGDDGCPSGSTTPVSPRPAGEPGLPAPNPPLKR